MFDFYAHYILTPKLHRFGLQNYNIHPTQNDVVLAIKIIIIIIQKKKKVENRGGFSRLHGQNEVAGPLIFWPRG
jgi:hypothetical protein